MPYRLKASESVPDGIKRIVLEEVDSAIEQLSRNGNKKRDEAIHEARKSVKKIRGAIRLVQNELGAKYRVENRRLRDLAHKLSEIRDAAGIIETFDSVIEKYRDNLQDGTLDSIRRGLEKNKQQTEENSSIGDVMKEAITTLRSTGKRVKAFPLKADGFPAIAPGLEKRFRAGRIAMTIAQEDSRPENYHEWRKRVKDHWYHVRLLESLWTEVMRAHESSLKELETWLGDDHNLVVLRDKLESKPEDYGDAKHIQLFLALADQHQKELREKSLSLGQRIYNEKPRQFTKTVAKLWGTWQNQPDSMKEQQKEAQGSKRVAQSASSRTSTRKKRTAA